MPVGALTSLQYRFEARPWEIQDVPGVRALPGRLQHPRHDPRGRRQARQFRNHPGGRRGWLCDKGRFAYPHLQAADRIQEPLAHGDLGLQPIGWDRGARAAPRSCSGCRRASSPRALGLGATEVAYGLAVLLRQGLGAHSAVIDEATSTALDAFQRPAGDHRRRGLVVVGDDDVVDRAPVVDLWLRKGARVKAPRS